MKPKLLLHCCCAPCSSAIIEHLSNYYDITLYFYNPNITARDEYDKRVYELKSLLANTWFGSFANKHGVKVYFEEYNPKPFYELAEGLETIHEGGARCIGCYMHRLKQTAEFAVENEFTQFSTTLTISPYKDSSVINKLGTSVASEYPNLMYMPFDFGFLYTRSLDLCEQYNLYQQDYCGCEYSRH